MQTFLTQNAYEGMELNLHMLVFLVVSLIGKSCVLRTWLLGSQPVERKFRHVRAYTPRGSTMVIMDMEGFLNRLKSSVFDEIYLLDAGANLHRKHGSSGDWQNPDRHVRLVNTN